MSFWNKIDGISCQFSEHYLAITMPIDSISSFTWLVEIALNTKPFHHKTHTVAKQQHRDDDVDASFCCILICERKNPEKHENKIHKYKSIE